MTNRLLRMLIICSIIPVICSCSKEQKKDRPCNGFIELTKLDNEQVRKEISSFAYELKDNKDFWMNYLTSIKSGKSGVKLLEGLDFDWSLIKAPIVAIELYIESDAGVLTGETYSNSNITFVTIKVGDRFQIKVDVTDDRLARFDPLNERMAYFVLNENIILTCWQ